MIDFYTWSTPNGYKVAIALEEMGLEYKVHPINIMKDEQFEPDFLEIAPNNKIPAIVDNDTGIKLFESGAILIYLAEKTGKFLSTDPAKRMATIQWLMWQMAGFGPMLGQAHYFMHFNPGVSEHAATRFRVEAERLYDVLDEQLEDNEFVAGELSIADFAILPWAARFEWHGIDLKDYENVLRWYRAMLARDGVQAGVKVPNPDYKLPVA